MRALAIVLLALLGAEAGGAQPVFPLWDRGDESAESDLAVLGGLLLSELHCVNCHEPSSSQPLPVWSAGDLRVAGRRLRSEALCAWISEPHPQTGRMPDLLHGLRPRERKEATNAIVAWLRDGATRRGEVEAAKPDAIQRGRLLFHRVGCVACHGPIGDVLDSSVPERGVRVVHRPLRRLQRFTRAGLSAFLRDQSGGHALASSPGLFLEESEAEAIAAFLSPSAEPEAASESSPAVELVEQGSALVQSLGCLRCHDRSGSQVVPSSQAPRLAELVGKTGGCLDTSSSSDVPRYELSSRQTVALRLAIEKGYQETGTPDRDAAIVSTEMRRYRCLACHLRSELGGASHDLEAYFHATEADLGDEGRLPPDLSGVGRKLRPEALTRIILGEDRARPYMLTRMPSFKPRVAEVLVPALVRLDHDPTERPSVRATVENQVGRNMWGRALVGTEGLSCISCHQLGGHPSLGIPALDLVEAPRRLRPEWFRDYLMDPARFRPGTRMPAFWPNGEPSLKGFGGSAERQIDSIWAYLSEFDQSRLPVGLVNERELELHPGVRPQVFRTFLEGVGNHAIAVGWQEGVHFAFDGLSPRWALAWRGRFLDAESTWDNRFTPMTPPLGTDVVAIQALPAESGRGREMKGYRLGGQDGVPTFRYLVDDVLIEDRLAPRKTAPAGLERQLRIAGSESTAVWAEIASGQDISGSGARWTVGDGLVVRLPQADSIVRRRVSAAGVRLELRLDPKRREGERVYYDW